MPKKLSPSALYNATITPIDEEMQAKWQSRGRDYNLYKATYEQVASWFKVNLGVDLSAYKEELLAKGKLEVEHGYRVVITDLSADGIAIAAATPPAGETLSENGGQSNAAAAETEIEPSAAEKTRKTKTKFKRKAETTTTDAPAEEDS